MDKKQQRFIPSDINVKADLNRLKVILKNENVFNSAVIRLKDHYKAILEKSKKKQRLSKAVAVDENALKIIENENLNEYCRNASGECKPIK